MPFCGQCGADQSAKAPKFCGQCGAAQAPAASASGAPPCGLCGKPLTAQFVKVGGRELCMHCVCKRCRHPLESAAARERGECGECTCSQCRTELAGGFFTVNNERWCQKCVDAEEARRSRSSAAAGAGRQQSCTACGKPLGGNVIQLSGKHSFHFSSACYKCNKCGDALSQDTRVQMTPGGALSCPKCADPDAISAATCGTCGKGIEYGETYAKAPDGRSFHAACVPKELTETKTATTTTRRAGPGQKPLSGIDYKEYMKATRDAGDRSLLG